MQRNIVVSLFLAHDARLRVFTAIKIHVMVLWVVTPSSDLTFPGCKLFTQNGLVETEP